ncbi:type II toxin-antitoxin system VapC family toxin [Actinokineospora sp.]|uniref:type II toxin-antitoxin system VapC family toxin n=1 Tax=Actinokineospora sp. TaxID=1872133 RepID=UPI003D6AE709
MIYLDSCAIVKLVAPEPESQAIADWLNERTEDALITSVLAEIEVPRALRRSVPSVLGVVTGVLSSVGRVEIDEPVRATAAAYIDANLRSLDAIHLATAESLVASGANLTAFVTYDKRLAAAAAEVGFAVVSPGVG